MSDWPEGGSPEYLAPRRCLREPIPEIFESSQLLDEAANAHIRGDFARAAVAIKEADKPEIWEWMESLRGKVNQYPDKQYYLRKRPVEDLPIEVRPSDRVGSGRPSVQIGRKVIERFGWNCAYCGITLIDRKARNILRTTYRDKIRWGGSFRDMHTALICMDNEFDHVLPRSRGGKDEYENLVTACSACNCGKEHWTIEQLGLSDPRNRVIIPSDWDGLARLLS